MSQMWSQFSLVVTGSSSGVAQVAKQHKQILCVCFKAQPPQRTEDCDDSL